MKAPGLSVSGRRISSKGQPVLDDRASAVLLYQDPLGPTLSEKCKGLGEWAREGENELERRQEGTSCKPQKEVPARPAPSPSRRDRVCWLARREAEGRRGEREAATCMHAELSSVGYSCTCVVRQLQLFVVSSPKTASIRGDAEKQAAGPSMRAATCTSVEHFNTAI